MTSPSRTARRMTGTALEPYRARFQPVHGDDVRPLDPIAMDPFRLVDEGHVRIFDLVTQEESVLTLWDVQREAITDWIDLEQLASGTLVCRNVVEEKSRAMGMTWGLLWASLWMVGWWPYPGLMLKTKEIEVDDGGLGSTPESLFGRIRFMWERLPSYVRPPLSFKHLLIRNERLAGARIVGNGAGPDPGRGGRYRWALIDEAARTPYGESVHSALKLACPEGRFYNSTPKGQENVYFRLRKTRPKGYVIRTDHWTRHPVYGEGKHVAGADPACALCRGTQRGVRYSPENPLAHRYPGKLTSPWYEGVVADMTDEEVASELDIDYSASVQGRVYPDFDERVHVLDRRLYDPAIHVELAFDFGISDPTSVIVFQDAPDTLRAVGEYEASGQTPQDVYDGLIEVLAELGVPLVELQPSFTKFLMAYGDPSGSALQAATGRSLVDDYRRAGLDIASRPSLAGSVGRTILAVRRMIRRGDPKPLRISAVDCPDLVEHFRLWAWPVDAQGNPKPNPKHPKHDRHSHAMDAARYYVAGKFTMAGSTPEAETIDRDEEGRLDPSIGYGMGL